MVRMLQAHLGMWAICSKKDLLLPYKTVYDNIALPLMLSHKTKQEIAAQIQPNLTIFWARWAH